MCEISLGGVNLGWDFYIFWRIGQAVLHGDCPYSVDYSFYPPAMAYFFIFFGIMPYLAAFGMWFGLNVVLVADLLRRMSIRNFKLILPWYFYTPVLFTLTTGQLDIFFCWIASRMKTTGWKTAILGSLLTLKPQVAFVVLPWYLFRWLRNDRPQLLRWSFTTLALQTWPLLIDPSIFGKWVQANADQLGWRLLNSPGIFALSNWNIPLIFLVVIAVMVVFWGVFQPQSVSRTAWFLGLPMGMWYQGVLLMGSAPWQLVVPVSWVAFGLAYHTKNAISLALIPVFIMGWQIWEGLRRSKEFSLASCAL